MHIYILHSLFTLVKANLAQTMVSRLSRLAAVCSSPRCSFQPGIMILCSIRAVYDVVIRGTNICTFSPRIVLASVALFVSLLLATKAGVCFFCLSGMRPRLLLKEEDAILGAARRRWGTQQTVTLLPQQADPWQPIPALVEQMPFGPHQLQLFFLFKALMFVLKQRLHERLTLIIMLCCSPQSIKKILTRVYRVGKPSLCEHKTTCAQNSGFLFYPSKPKPFPHLHIPNAHPARLPTSWLSCWTKLKPLM